MITNLKKISSGSIIIDEFLGGGFEPEVITTIYGGAATGKTNICLLAAINIAKQGKKVVYVDTESGFSIERAKQIKSDYESIMNNIIFFSPSSFSEQTRVFTKIKKMADIEEISLVIIDSIAMLYRLTLNSHEEAYKTNKELAKQLKTLSDISKYGIPVIVTNQVYADFDKKDEIKMVGGTLPMYFSKCIIKLENIEGERKATIAKHRSMEEGKSISFEIINKGIEKYKGKKKRFTLF